MENEEVIRRRMEQTREALSEKLATLEQKVTDSVSAVTDTVANVSEKVHDGVESVKDAVDVQAHVEHHPWLTVGGAVLCGYLLGNLLVGEKKKSSQPAPSPRMPERSNGNGRQYQEKLATPTGDNWLGAFEPEVRQLKSLALGATLGTVREMLTEQVPPHMADRLREIIDTVTVKAGGDPLPSTDWAGLKSPQGEPEESKVNV